MFSWLRCNRAAAFIEFALVAPFLLVLVLGGVEMTRYATILMRLDKATYDMANIIAQEVPATNPSAANQITVTRVTDALNNFSRLMSPFDDLTRQRVIVSSVQRDGGATLVRWQVAGGGSFAGITSIVNGAGPGINAAVANTPVAFNGPRAADINAQLAGMLPDENMLVIETVFRYEPILQPVLTRLQLTIGRETFRREHFFAPRQGLLRYLPPTWPVP